MRIFALWWELSERSLTKAIIIGARASGVITENSVFSVSSRLVLKTRPFTINDSKATFNSI